MTTPSTAPSHSFTPASPPTFDSVADERRHRLERLAGVCRVFGRLGYAEGLLGHITVRNPEHADRFWINPIGVSFRQMKVSDLVQVDHGGTVLVGNRSINPVGFRLHAAVHAARPEVGAICHAHSLYGKAWSSLGRRLDPITQDSAVFFGQQALITAPRIALDEAQGREFAANFGNSRVAIQVGHGLFSTGETVDEAAWWFVAMETSAKAQMLAEAAGTPILWEPEEATLLAATLGAPLFGWSSFQPLWDDIVVSDPDLYD